MSECNIKSTINNSTNLPKINEDYCVICLDTIEQPLAILTLPCGHIFHWECFKTYISIHGEGSTCPVCRRVLTIHTINVQEIDGYDYPRVSIPLHTECLYETSVQNNNDIPLKPLQNKFELTIYTPQSFHPTSDNNTNKRYVQNTFYTDHMIIERLDNQRSPMADSNEPMVRYQQQLLLEPIDTHNRINIQHPQYQRNSISCFCKCMLFTMNRCCECLAIGIIITVTYGVIYMIKHIARN